MKDMSLQIYMVLFALFRNWPSVGSRYSRVFLVSIIAAGALFGLPGCNQKEPSVPSTVQQVTNPYADWTWYTYGRVKIFHPPGHLHLDRFKDYCQNYETSIRQISQLLAMEPPVDTLVIYYYTGFGQGRELTGHEYPYFQDGVVHFWLPSFTGPTLVDWLLPHWVAEKSQYRFLDHGLRALFDFSGQNYHQATYNNLRDSFFVRLADLANDPSIDSDTERVQSAEAASFCAFIIAQYGALRLKTVYQYKKPFGEMVPEVFQKPVDSLEQDWLNFAFHNLPDSVRTDRYRRMALPAGLAARSTAGGLSKTNTQR